MNKIYRLSDLVILPPTDDIIYVIQGIYINVVICSNFIVINKPQL